MHQLFLAMSSSGTTNEPPYDLENMLMNWGTWFVRGALGKNLLSPEHMLVQADLRHYGANHSLRKM